MSSSQRYYYEYQLSQHDNDAIPPNPADDVYYNIVITYILKKRQSPGQADDEETLGSHYRGFYMLSYNLMDPQNHLDTVFMRLWVCDDDVRQRLVRDIMDFPNQIRADPINAGRTTFAMLVSIKVYIVQQEDETVEDARERSIVCRFWSENPSFIQSLEKVKVEIDNSEQEECCICLNKPCVGEEISILPCPHAYHYKCISVGLVKSKLCPLCRKPVHWN